MKRDAPITLSTYVANALKQMEDEEFLLKRHEQEFKIKVGHFDLPSEYAELPTREIDEPCRANENDHRQALMDA